MRRVGSSEELSFFVSVFSCNFQLNVRLVSRYSFRPHKPPVGSRMVRVLPINKVVVFFLNVMVGRSSAGSQLRRMELI